MEQHSCCDTCLFSNGQMHTNCACRGDLVRSRNTRKPIRSQRIVKGRPSHATVRLRVLVQKRASVSSHWRRATCYYRQHTWASELATHYRTYCAPKFTSFSIFDAPSIPLPTWRAFGFSVALSLSHRSGGRWVFVALTGTAITHWDSLYQDDRRDETRVRHRGTALIGGRARARAIGLVHVHCLPTGARLKASEAGFFSSFQGHVKVKLAKNSRRVRPTFRLFRRISI